MLSQLFADNIAEEFAFPFTSLQAQAAKAIGEFLTDPRSDQAFLLKGYPEREKPPLFRPWCVCGKS